MSTGKMLDIAYGLGIAILPAAYLIKLAFASHGHIASTGLIMASFIWLAIATPILQAAIDA
jgi:hypothetical protein